MRDENTLERMIEAGEFSIDLNGHSPSGSIRDGGRQLSDGEEEKILKSLQTFAYRDGVLLGMAIAGQATATFETTLSCLECGDYLNFGVMGKVVKVASACEFPEGVQFPLRSTFDVPSGRLAFADKFTFLTDPVSDKDARSMSMAASKRGFEAWCASGFPNAGCGNSCPAIYRLGDTVIISSEFSDEGELPAGLQEVGTICTDFWSWHCGDFEKLHQAAAAAGQKLHAMAVVEMEPGRYEVSLHSLHRDHLGRKFATIKPCA